jgi:hypothetical protein
MEPHRIFHSNFYTYKLLHDIFIDKGHIIHFYTPIDYTLDSIDEDNKNRMKVSNLKDIYDINFRIQIPQPQNYDVLLLETQLYKKWYNNERDMRNIVAGKFQENNKNIIVIADSTFIETRLLNLDNIMYGTKSSLLLKLDNKELHKIYHFNMAPLTLLCNPKTKPLTHQNFCKKYGLDKNLKIIAFLPGKKDKWCKSCYKNKDIKFRDELATDNYYKNNEQIHWFIKNQKKITKILKELGYQLVGKFHQRDFSKFNNTNKYTEIVKEGIKYVIQYDLYELIKYSTFALTFGSTMVYQLYLYDLPSIEIGTGFYFAGWAYNNTKDFSYMNYIKSYNFGKELIYGHVADFDKLTDNTKEYFNYLLSKKIVFKYKYNNPLYGESYGKTLDDTYKSIIKSIILMILKDKNNKDEITNT